MINIHQAILALDSSIVNICGDVAYDVNGNEVSYDKAQAEDKLAELQAQAEADKQIFINSRASALAKLAALGLTENEIKAILGVE